MPMGSGIFIMSNLYYLPLISLRAAQIFSGDLAK
jgi:hypothetical protein